MRVLFNKSKGLGDTIEKVTTVTGIKAVVDTVSKAIGKDCGCGARKLALNERFPYNIKDNGNTKTSGR